MDIVSQYPSWYFLLCICLGIAYAFFLYKGDKKIAAFNKSVIIGLATLRFLLITMLAALLLAPLIKYNQREVVDPIIVIAEDRSSSSVSLKDSNFIKTDFQTEIRKVKSSLENDYQLNHYYFGEKFRKEDSSGFEDRLTDFDLVWAGIEDRYNNRNLGAVILISDGIYNSGLNPYYSNLWAKYPIYAVALGDTVRRKDIKIDRLLHNEIAFLGNKFPLQIDIQATKTAGERSKISVLKNGKKVYQEELNFREDFEATSVDLFLTADEIGLQRYEVIIEEIEGESNSINNTKDFYIDVLDGKQNILILYSLPHPDVNAIKSAIEINENYELTVSSVEDWNGKLNDFDLLIAYQIPNVKSLKNEILTEAEIDKMPIWSIAATATSLNQFDKQKWPTKIYNQKNQSNEAIAILESSFPYFTLSEDFQNNMKQWPPLEVPFANYQLNPNSYALFKQQIGAVKTKMPLMAFSDRNNHKMALLSGEGLWKWRMEDYRRNKSFKIFNELITKTVQYLSLKTDQSLFRLSHEKEIFENEELLFNAQLYNESYELINEKDVEISILNSEGEEFKYIFNKSKNAYNLKVSGLESGRYQYEARVNYANEILIERGEFSVKKLQLEAAELVANHNLLYQLANKSGGKLYYSTQLEEIVKDIQERKDLNSIAYTKQEVEDIINMKWIFFILLALLSIEWFLRKRNGAY